MANQNETFQAKSLTQHFDAPDDYIGYFGWICGYSADALFLNDVAERFTRKIKAEREREGQIALAMTLDPGNQAISMLDVPSVAHLPIKDIKNKPFSLLHAKVALLGFRHHKDQTQWILRLLVSTGNWTRQTLEESIDLIWRVDVESQYLNELQTGTDIDCADIAAAWDMFQYIQQYYDDSLLKASRNDGDSEATICNDLLEEWIKACSEKANKEKSRFIDNRKNSFLDQLSNKIGSRAGRNYLAMGSGFYESASSSNELPIEQLVPSKIVKLLRDKKLLTKHCEIDIFVNPQACQAISTSVEALEKNSITVRPAATPKIVYGQSMQRTLHAKFLFSANFKSTSKKCNNAWVYLGSGNLTSPGFVTNVRQKANLEAGVIFSPELYWEKEKKALEERVVTNQLPIQWETKIDFNKDSLSTGFDMELRDIKFVSPPVAWVEWYNNGKCCELRIPDQIVSSAQDNYELLDGKSDSCIKTESGFQWLEDQPREVCIRWQEGVEKYEAMIPVMDQYGRLAATKMPELDLEAGMLQLMNFPVMSIGDDESNTDEETYSIHCDDNIDKRNSVISSYPIREMMSLIENIAAKQVEVSELNWPLWCNRLEQTLNQVKGSDPVVYFRDELKINPLSPLYHEAFRPFFAETNSSDFGSLYAKALDRIEDSWKVKGLSGIEGRNER